MRKYLLIIGLSAMATFLVGAFSGHWAGDGVKGQPRTSPQGCEPIADTPGACMPPRVVTQEKTSELFLRELKRSPKVLFAANF